MKQPVRFVLTLIVCLALSLSGVLVGVPATQAAETYIWTQLPLYGGNVSVLAINPKTPTTVYASTGSQVFRSVDGGGTWIALNTSFAGAPPAVMALAIDPVTPSTLYAGTNGSGLFRSADSGDHWTAANTGLGVYEQQIWSLAINLLTPTTLYAGNCYGGVYRSTDSGSNWTAVNPNPSAPPYGQILCPLAIDPLTPTTLYAGIEDGSLFRSTDRGDHWTPVVTGVFTRYILPLAFDTNVPAALYAGTWGGGLFRYGVTPSHAFTTTISPSAGGSIVRVPNATSYATDTVVTLTASPATGYAFTGWSGSLTGMKNPVTVTMNADKKITASFARKTKRVLQLRVGNVTMYVDGQSATLDATPIILNSRTLLPIRAVVEATGGTITWNAPAQKATIVRKGKTLELWIGRNVAKLNGKSVKIDTNPKVVPVIRAGRTLLPLRFVAETLAFNVQWDAVLHVITITFTP
jgi:uncharacterized repeat protein (TIGR02543 family)